MATVIRCRANPSSRTHDHDMHRYSGAETGQPAQRFSEGTVGEIAPRAIRHSIDHWEAIAESWKS
jgi:hypothetical protein